MRNLEIKCGTNKHFLLKKRSFTFKKYIYIFCNIYITKLRRRRRQQLTEQGYMHMMEMISLLKHNETLPSEQSQQHLRHSFPT
jgi:hypothetical protein